MLISSKVNNSTTSIPVYNRPMNMTVGNSLDEIKFVDDTSLHDNGKINR